jgi:CheY-like chemotaxis protein
MVGILGYTVIEANGAEPALRILAKYPVALVLTDVVMPGPITSLRRHRGALPPPRIVC